MVVAIATHTACLYIAPVNERPRARVDEVTVGPYHIGDRLAFSASKSTDDGPAGELRVSWQARICDDQASCEILDLSTTSASTRDDVAVIADRKGEIVVLATITDGHGATDTIDARVDVVNQVPAIEVQLSGFPDPGDSGGFVLGLPVEIAASIVDPDGDELDVQWEAFAPMGSSSTVDVVPVDGEAETYTLSADDAGRWDVRITADDGDGGVTEHTEPLVFAADGPPCIGATAPVAAPVPLVISEPTRFSVQAVFDALDGYPRPVSPHPAVGITTFAWKLASPASGGALIDISATAPDVLIDPATYAPGDRLTLRVEVDDRNDHLPLACAESQARCDTNDPTNPAPACSQRATWEIEIR